MQHLFKVLFVIAVSVTVVIAATVGVMNVMSSPEGLSFLSFDSPGPPTSEAEHFAAHIAGQELARRDGPLSPFHRPEWRRGGPPGRGRPGQVLSPALYEALRLTDEQKQQLAALQSEVDAQMEQILTAEQQNQLQSMREGFGRLGREGRPSAPSVHE